jgi:hypothetical protein
MMWQHIGVVLIVGAAVAYVARKFLPRRSNNTAAVTFVPLSQIKSTPKR